MERVYDPAREPERSGDEAGCERLIPGLRTREGVQEEILCECRRENSVGCEIGSTEGGSWEIRPPISGICRWEDADLHLRWASRRRGGGPFVPGGCWRQEGKGALAVAPFVVRHTRRAGTIANHGGFSPVFDVDYRAPGCQARHDRNEVVNDSKNDSGMTRELASYARARQLLSANDPARTPIAPLCLPGAGATRCAPLSPHYLSRDKKMTSLVFPQLVYR